jgi:DNA-binding NtrC family response regulator
VLVVDDQPDIVSSLSVFLRYSFRDLEIRGATSPTQALDVLRRERVDLVLADYRMPGMDGLEFLEAVGRLVPGVPRILFTGHWDHPGAEPPSAAERVFSKTIPLEELVEGVQSLLAAGTSTAGADPRPTG